MNKNNKFMAESKGQITAQARKRAVTESFTPGEKRYPKVTPLLSSSRRFIPSGFPVEGYSGSVGFVISRFYSSKENNKIIYIKPNFNKPSKDNCFTCPENNIEYCRTFGK